MATQVPFNPVPQVAAQDRPTPYRSLDVPAAAFGAATAAATQHMGSTLQGVGNEIFGRAVQMQEMNEQASANEALTDFQNQQLQKFVEFQNRFGKDAYNHLPEFQAEMEGLRSQVRGRLGSPYAQRLYDSESRNSQWRMNMSASFHAATQLKQYNDNAIDARISSNEDATLTNPTDFGAFTGKLAENKALIEQKYKDQDPAVIAQKVAESRSALATNQVKGLADTHQAGAAGKLMKKYLEDGTITGDSSKLQSYVNNKMATQFSKTQSEGIVSGHDMAIGQGKVDVNLGLEGLASIESSNKWLGRHATPVPATATHPAGVAVGRYGIMSYNINPWLKEAGMQPMTVDEFIADHEAQTKVAKFQYNKLREQYGNDNEVARHWLGLGTDPNGMSTNQYAIQFRRYLATHSSEKDLADVAERVGNGVEASTGVDGYSETLRHQVLLKRGEQDRIEAKDQMMAKQALYGAMQPGPDGKLITTRDELLSDPSRAYAFDHMRQTDQLQVLKQLDANQRHGGYILTEEKQAKYLQFLGTFNDPNRTPEAMDWLQKYDIPAAGMPAPYQKQMMKMQQSLIDMQGADPEPYVNNALNILESQGILRGIGYKKAGLGKQPDDSAMFRGALTELIHDYIQKNREEPDRDTIIKMGQTLAEKRAMRGPFYPGEEAGEHWTIFTGQRRYQDDVPAQASAIITRDFTSRYGRAPTPVQVHNLYIAAMYKSLFSKPIKPAPPSQAPNLLSPDHQTND